MLADLPNNRKGANDCFGPVADRVAGLSDGQLFDPSATSAVLRFPAAIFAPASTQGGPARRATATVPIVFAQHADPVGLGDVTSLSRPGGNITGMSMLLTEVSVKELEILEEILPGATRVGLLWNPTTPSHPTAVKAVGRAAQTLGVELVSASASTVSEVQDRFQAMAHN
ncbi:ABC transporter substrate binding protein [Bradyrhizobium guangdongense]